MDSYKTFAGILQQEMHKKTKQSLLGVPVEFGRLVPDPYMFLQLDRYSKLIQDYMLMHWTLDVKIPIKSRVVKIASPVNPDGTDIPGVTGYSQLSRLDFHVLPDIEPEKDISLTGRTMQVQAKMRSFMQAPKHLEPGDRVLVATPNNGQEHIILGKVRERDA